MSTDKDNKAKKSEKETNNKDIPEADKNKQNKLDLFEEDDLFEEFEEGIIHIICLSKKFK
jgi:hypothetical protein